MLLTDVSGSMQATDIRPTARGTAAAHVRRCCPQVKRRVMALTSPASAEPDGANRTAIRSALDACLPAAAPDRDAVQAACACSGHAERAPSARPRDRAPVSGAATRGVDPVGAARAAGRRTSRLPRSRWAPEDDHRPAPAGRAWRRATSRRSPVLAQIDPRQRGFLRRPTRTAQPVYDAWAPSRPKEGAPPSSPRARRRRASFLLLGSGPLPALLGRLI